MLLNLTAQLSAPDKHSLVNFFFTWENENLGNVTKLPVLIFIILV